MLKFTSWGTKVIENYRIIIFNRSSFAVVSGHFKLRKKNKSNKKPKLIPIFFEM